MYHIFVITGINIIFWAALHIFGAALITTFAPKRIYIPTNFLFRERAFEKKLYRAIKVGKWKDKLPVYRKKGDLDRRHMPNHLTGEMMEQCITDSCKAELVHLLIGVSGFSSILFVIFRIEPLPIFALIATMMLFVHIPFILIQRYNRPRMLKLRYRLNKHCLSVTGDDL